MNTLMPTTQLQLATPIYVFSIQRTTLNQKNAVFLRFQ